MTSKISVLSTAILIFASAVCAADYPVYHVAMRPSFANVQTQATSSQTTPTETTVSEKQATTPQIPGRSPYRATLSEIKGNTASASAFTKPSSQTPQLPGRSPYYATSYETKETVTPAPTSTKPKTQTTIKTPQLPGRSPYRVALKDIEGSVLPAPTLAGPNSQNAELPDPQLPKLAPSAKPISVEPKKETWRQDLDYYQATTVAGQPYRRGFDCSNCESYCAPPCASSCGADGGTYSGFVRVGGNYAGYENSCYGPCYGNQAGACGEVFPVRIGKCSWESARMIQWEQYAQGEYVGPARTAHVSEYRLRVDDELDLVYRLTREEQPNPYALNVGDEVRVESTSDPSLDRDLLIQPDGTITLLLLGQVHATGLTVPQLRDKIEELYRKFYKNPSITVTPLRVNSKLDDLRNAVDSRFGQGGQNRFAKVVPDGTISLPAIGVIQAQGLTLNELRVELREAYRREVEGIEVIPVLSQRAPRYVYVLGEVALPGRYEMTGPTTLMQALAMAGSWNVGAYLKQIVVFRRGHDWRLKATMLDIRPALYGRQPCPPDEIWLSDSDVIVVPKNPILVADEFIDLVFTRGIYGVFPMYTTLNFAKLSSL